MFLFIFVVVVVDIIAVVVVVVVIFICFNFIILLRRHSDKRKIVCFSECSSFCSEMRWNCFY